MEAALTNGQNMTVVGMSAVFFALSMLILAVTGLARILAARAARSQQDAAAKVGSKIASGTDRPGAAEQDHLILVALAAYAAHRTRSVVVRASVPPSPWLRAGRSTQVSRMNTHG